jgi:hypothetical protein
MVKSGEILNNLSDALNDISKMMSICVSPMANKGRRAWSKWKR